MNKRIKGRPEPKSGNIKNGFTTIDKDPVREFARTGTHASHTESKSPGSMKEEAGGHSRHVS